MQAKQSAVVRLQHEHGDATDRENIQFRDKEAIVAPEQPGNRQGGVTLARNLVAVQQKMDFH